MESDRDFDPAEARLTLERAEAAPYVDYPPLPWWYHPAVGLFAAALTLLLAQPDHTFLTSLGLLGLVAVEGAFLGWYSRRHGALPSFRRPPQEFRRVLRIYVIGAVAVVAVVALIAWQVGPLAGACLAFATVTVGLAAYDRLYERAAQQTRARLG